MAPSSTSYLQTLPNDEAAAFLSALQKVKDHLSEELQSMNQQVQQKTLQLQGIETLLAEAKAKGTKLETPSASTSEATLPNLLDTIAPTPTLDDSQNNSSNGSSNSAEAPAVEAVTSAPSRQKKQTKNAKQSSSSKAKQTSKAATTSKGSTSTKKKSTSKPKASGKQTTKGVDLRELLQPAFQDKTFGDAVGEILEQANQPLHVDDLLDKMYNELSDPDYQRAKVSLANVLSVGSSKGRWKNVSKGMYASNAVAAS